MRGDTKMETSSSTAAPISTTAVDTKHMGRAAGRSEMIKFLEGKPLTRGQSIRAMCYSCLGFCEAGGFDCEVKDCPLYPFMPYNRNKVKDSDEEDLS